MIHANKARKCTAVLLLLLLSLLLLSACGKESEALVFTATVEEVFENSILVEAAGDHNITKASVSFKDGRKIEGISVGDTIIITADPEIRETYPEGITARKIEKK